MNYYKFDISLLNCYDKILYEDIDELYELVKCFSIMKMLSDGMNIFICIGDIINTLNSKYRISVLDEFINSQFQENEEYDDFMPNVFKYRAYKRCYECLFYIIRKIFSLIIKDKIFNDIEDVDDSFIAMCDEVSKDIIIPIVEEIIDKINNLKLIYNMNVNPRDASANVASDNYDFNISLLNNYDKMFSENISEVVKCVCLIQMINDDKNLIVTEDDINNYFKTDRCIKLLNRYIRTDDEDYKNELFNRSKEWVKGIMKDK